MKWRLWRRRHFLTSPSVAVRNAMPWPLRWLLLALMLGFSASVSLWAFEFGKEIAGLERDTQSQLESLRGEVVELRAALTQARSVALASESLLTAEKAAQEQLQAEIKRLENDNRNLRNDLGFFERLIPSASNEPVAVRGLQLERLGETELKWQVLLIQAMRNAHDFKGVLEIGLSGLVAGKPWSQDIAVQQEVSFRQYLRLEGLLDLPPRTVVKTVTAKVRQGDEVKTVQVLKLP